MNIQKPFFINRISYLLDRSGKNMLSFETRYERGEWDVSLILTLIELFSYSRGQVTPVSNPSVIPEMAGVHGRVFIDANANGIMDSGEPGVTDIQVVSDDMYKSKDR